MCQAGNNQIHLGYVVQRDCRDQLKLFLASPEKGVSEFLFFETTFATQSALRVLKISVPHRGSALIILTCASG